MVATGQINFIPKTQVVVPVYDKMASIKCLIVKIYQKLRFLTFEKNFQETKEIVQLPNIGFTVGFC